MKLKFLKEFGKAFVPEKFRPNLKNYLLKAGIIEIPYPFFGGLFVLSLIITYFVFLLALFPYITDTLGISGLFLGIYAFFSWTIVNILAAGLLMSGVYFYYDMIIYRRTKEMESVLIEFLQFVSENLKGGMSFDRALWSSVKPRFKVLSNEIRIAAKKAMTGEDVEDALEEFTEKYDSSMLKRSFNLMIEGMRGGGHMAELIDKVVENLKQNRELKEDMAATSLSYVIFISFIVMVMAPGLFALSKQLLIIMGTLGESLGSAISGANSGLPISFDSVAITPHEFSIFAQTSLAIIAGFSAMIISIIKDGQIRAGAKYIPIFIIVSLVLFRLVAAGLEFAMSGLFA
jgi:pilus assembly protein TadC